MSDVAGMEELRRMTDCLHQRPADIARVSALLRNRQELVQMIVVIRALSDADMLDADKIDELYAKAKELDND